MLWHFKPKPLKINFPSCFRSLKNCLKFLLGVFKLKDFDIKSNITKILWVTFFLWQQNQSKILFPSKFWGFLQNFMRRCVVLIKVLTDWCWWDKCKVLIKFICQSETTCVVCTYVSPQKHSGNCFSIKNLNCEQQHCHCCSAAGQSSIWFLSVAQETT